MIVGMLTVSAMPARAQSTTCQQSVIDGVNLLLGTSGASGLDTLRIDFNLMGTTQCLAVGGNARVAPQDTIEIGHCETNRPADLCLSYDLQSNLTAVSISGPGYSGSPGSDTALDLSAGVYVVTMTVNGVTSGFTFEVIEIGPDDQRLKSEPIIVGNASNPQLTVVKSATLASGADIPVDGVAVGDVIKYTYLLTNTGNVPFDSVSLSDDHRGYGTLGPVTGCALTADNGTQNDTAINASGSGLTAFGALDEVTCEAIYTVVQADIENLQ